MLEFIKGYQFEANIILYIISIIEVLYFFVRALYEQKAECLRDIDERQQKRIVRCYFASAGVLFTGLVASIFLSVRVLAVSIMAAMIPMLILRISVAISNFKAGYKNVCGTLLCIIVALGIGTFLVLLFVL